MKWMILSDLHGSLTAFERAAAIFERDGFDWMILAGDYLNHGPRNGIPAGHDPIGLSKALNRYADRIIAVRGNCDSEVDQMLLDFPCLADYAALFVGGRRIIVTHGHLWGGAAAMTGAGEADSAKSGVGAAAGGYAGRSGPVRQTGTASPPLWAGDVLICGHTHVAGLGTEGGIICVNPGSVTFPKGGTGAGYAVLTEERIELVDFERGIIDSLSLR